MPSKTLIEAIYAAVFAARYEKLRGQRDLSEQEAREGAMSDAAYEAHCFKKTAAERPSLLPNPDAP